MTLFGEKQLEVKTPEMSVIMSHCRKNTGSRSISCDECLQRPLWQFLPFTLLFKEYGLVTVKKVLLQQPETSLVQHWLNDLSGTPHFKTIRLALKYNLDVFRKTWSPLRGRWRDRIIPIQDFDKISLLDWSFCVSCLIWLLISYVAVFPDLSNWQVTMMLS